MPDAIIHVEAVRQRLLLTRHDERRASQGLAQRLDDCLRNHVIGDAHAHRVLLLVEHDARDLLGPPQDKRVWSGGQRLHGAELVIIDDDKLTQLGKRVAQQ